MLRPPTRKQFSKIARLLAQWGIGDDLKKIEEAWLQTKVVPRKQYESMLRLLEIFAQHLSLVAKSINYPVQAARAIKHCACATVHPGAPRGGVVSRDRRQNGEHE